MDGKYILDADGNPVLCDDLFEWSAWYTRATEDRSRVIAQDRDEGPNHEEIFVSTVFLGLDYSFGMGGPPILWETMIFNGPLKDFQNRYSTREAALKGHQAACRLLRMTLKKLRR